MNRFFTLLSMALLLSGCATKLYVPGNRFMNPEASGAFAKGDFKVGGVGVTHVQVADDITTGAPDTTPVLLKNSSMLIGLQLGLFSRFDVYYNSVFGAPGAAGGKFQLIGDPQAAAKKGNFSLSIAGGAFMGKLNQSTTVGTDKGESNIDFGGYEIMVPIGYRFEDGFLFYLTPFQSRVEAKTVVSLTTSGVKTVTSEPDGFGVMRGLSVGARVGGAFFLGVEASATETTWTREKPSTLESAKFTDTAVGATIGGQW